jgi:hypothetical protein
MKTICFILLFFSVPSQAAEGLRTLSPLMMAEEPETAEKMVDPEAKANEAQFSKLPVGARAFTQNSYGKWEGQVVEVVQHLDDHSVRVKYKTGESPMVSFKNLRKNLSAPKTCGISHDAKICKGDHVLYPFPTASLMVPEAEVVEIFESDHALLLDGDEFVTELSKLGKSVDCSPQKPSICVKDPVVAEGYRAGEKYSFEGMVEKAYTNGVVLVRSGTSLLQFDALSVKKVIDSDPANPAVVSSKTAPKEAPVSAPDLPPPPGAESSLDAQ